MTIQYSTPDIFIKDPLRASVEAATGGRCTVLYSQYDGNYFPNVMYALPPLTMPLDTLGEYVTLGDSGIRSDADILLNPSPSGNFLHPAFTTNLKNAENFGQPDPIPIMNAQLFISVYPASPVVGSGAFISWPNLPMARRQINRINVIGQTKLDSGWHVMNALEWGAVQMQIDLENKKGPVGPQDEFFRELDETDGMARLNFLLKVDGQSCSNVYNHVSGAVALSGGGPDIFNHNRETIGMSLFVTDVGTYTPGLWIKGHTSTHHYKYYAYQSNESKCRTEMIENIEYDDPAAYGRQDESTTERNFAFVVDNGTLKLGTRQDAIDAIANANNLSLPIQNSSIAWKNIARTTRYNATGSTIGPNLTRLDYERRLALAYGIDPSSYTATKDNAVGEVRFPDAAPETTGDLARLYMVRGKKDFHSIDFVKDQLVGWNPSTETYTQEGYDDRYYFRLAVIQ